MISAIRPSIVYGYGRVSQTEDDQFYSPRAQREKIEAEYAALKAKEPHLEWGNIFFDEFTSKRYLFERPAGRLLNARLLRGDHVIIPKCDRAFRVLRDQLASRDSWDQRGIVYHFLDVPFTEHQSPESRLISNVMGAFAEFERLRIGQRTKDALQWKRRKSLPVNQICPMGWSVVGHKRTKQFIVNEAERQELIEMVEVVDRLGWTRAHIQFDKERRMYRGKRIGAKDWSRVRRAIAKGFPLHNGSLVAGKPDIEHYL